MGRRDECNSDRYVAGVSGERLPGHDARKLRAAIGREDHMQSKHGGVSAGNTDHHNRDRHDSRYHRDAPELRHGCDDQYGSGCGEQHRDRVDRGAAIGLRDARQGRRTEHAGCAAGS